VSGPARRPGDGGWDSRARPGEDPAGVSFATTRIDPRRRGPLVFLVALVAILAGTVAIGLIGRASTDSAGLPPVGLTASATPPATNQPTPAAPSAAMFGNRPPPAAGGTLTSGPGSLQLVARVTFSGISVHGSGFAPNIVWVFVSLRDHLGRIQGWTSVSVPAVTGTAPSDGPTLRFDIEFPMPVDVAGPLVIEANAYDNTTQRIAWAGIEVPSTPG